MTRSSKLNNAGVLLITALILSILATRTWAADVGAADSRVLDEIVVTAQKREERLQDVPVPVTSLDAETLADANLVRLQDYYSSIPNLNYVPGDNGGATLTIRGISTAGGNPTVGVLIDGVPYGSSTALGGGSAIPDIDPSELERVEVLRGPQGTLWGASSLGGLVNFVTVDPTVSGVSGRAQTDLNSVVSGNGPGYGGRGAVNIPLGDTLAFRASVFARHDTGYIDNIQSGQSGVNWGNTAGAHLAVLWRPDQAVSVKVSALVQNGMIHGYPEAQVGPGFGDLQQDALPGTGLNHQSIQAYSATLNAKLGNLDLTSLTGYNINSFYSTYDYTLFFGPYTQQQFGVTGTPVHTYAKNDKFTEELRLSSPTGGRVEWLLGGFYTRENSPNLQQVLAASETGAVVGNWVNFDWATKYQEYAGFADLTLHLTNQFDIQFGGRESRNQQSYWEVDTGPYIPIFEGVPSPVVVPTVNTSQSVFTYLVTPRLKLSSDFMLYARLASGYRPGGPNDGATASSGVPLSFGSDKTKNYEIGAKGNVFSRSTVLDLSLYRIDWKNIQLGLVDPNTGLSYFANGSEAKSQGIEISAESKPLKGLSVSGWVAWNDAKLTQLLPPASAAYGVAGDRLPDSSRFSGNFSLEQAFPLSAGVKGFVGGTVSYVGDRLGGFNSAPPAPPPRQVYPAYVKTDLRAGANWELWTASVFVNNVTDKRGILTGGIGTTNPSYFYYIQPRMIGLSVVRTF